MNSTSKMNKKRIAVVAHENKKVDLINWSYDNRNVLMHHEIIGIGTAGNILEGTINRPVQKLAKGPFGGDQQLSAMISEGKIDIIIFFSNPAGRNVEDSDIEVLQQAAIDNNIAVAANLATADYILASSLIEQEAVAA